MSTKSYNSSNALLDWYVTYSKEVILDRALPDIRDGMKPVQRRIIYDMDKNNRYHMSASGKINKSYKSARIVGDVMGKYHPHGDSSIYGALVYMSNQYGYMNEPLVFGDGSFGKCWSDTITPSSMRYTEASLSSISRELVDGINENAVDYVPNFDDTEVEPVVLPTKFPNVLVNATGGVAVGLRSEIPSFTLKSVCEATKAVALNKAKTADDLIDILGAPDFPTGGFVHVSRDNMRQLIETGKANFVLSGAVGTDKNRIVVTNIPFNTTIDKIEEQLRKASDEKIKEIKDVINISGYNKKTHVAKMGLYIVLKSGSDVSKVLAKINKYTDLRKTISYDITVLTGSDSEQGVPKRMGVMELLSTWIDWRQSVIKRQYDFRLTKEHKREHELAAWEKIKDRLKEFVNDVVNNKEEALFNLCEQKYGLDREQTEYLVSKQIRTLTQNRLDKSLNDLAESRKTITEYENMVNNKDARIREMIKQLDEIKNKYGKDRNSKIADEIVQKEEDDKLAEVIEDTPVTICMTENGYVKKFMDVNALMCGENLTNDVSGNIKWQVTCNNRDTLLVFVDNGCCYKIPVHVFDNSSRTQFKDNVWTHTQFKDQGAKIVYVTNAGDYSGYFNIIYGNGRGTTVGLASIMGNRKRYMNVFEDVKQNGGAMFTKVKKYFIITKHKFAGLVDTTYVTDTGKRSKYTISRIRHDDSVIGIVPYEKAYKHDELPYEEEYSKGYAVKIKSWLPIFDNSTETKTEDTTSAE